MTKSPSSIAKHMRFSKQSVDAEWQYLTMIQWPEEVRPKNLTYENGVLSYDFIDAPLCNDWRQARDLAYNCLWQGYDIGVSYVERQAYCDYVFDKTPPSYRAQFKYVSDLIMTSVLMQPMNTVHGDLTLYNIIGKTFIDPAPPRLHCIEIDESKILQSLDGFGVVYRNQPQPMAYPKMPTRPVHWALLVTHYIRLLHHVTHAESLRFAYQRIGELLCVLSHT